MKPTKRINKRILILCEDAKSSLLYLKSFKGDEEFRRRLGAVSVEVYQPNNNSPMGLIKEAIRKQAEAKTAKNAYDEIWLVSDRDQHAEVAEAFNILQGCKNIYWAFSNICFEYWVLLHFERSLRPFNTCEQLIDYIAKKHASTYKKSENVFSILRPRINDAIGNGKWVIEQQKSNLANGKKQYEINPYTNIHELVDKLIYGF